MLSPWPFYSQEEIQAASSILQNGSVNFWTGNECIQFEQEFALATDSKYAVALANGSVALSAAYRSLGITQGDEVITTPRSFIATSSELALLGATPVFADVDPISGLITASTIEPLITGRTKAIVVVHLAGWPADMQPILSLARKYNLFVVEDCAQAHGAKINGQSVGSFGDVSAWSFCQDKIISTAGEGGMITTNRQSIYNAIYRYKDHGKAEFLRTSDRLPSTSYQPVHLDLGTNLRMTEYQAAIGRVQLRRLNDTNDTRRSNATYLIDYLSDSKLIKLYQPPAHLTHAWYKLYGYLDFNHLSESFNRDQIISGIRALGYPCSSGTGSELYHEPCLIQHVQKSHCPTSRALGASSLMFLVHPTITKTELQGYANAISEVLQTACR